MQAYKLTDKNDCTYGETQWGDDVRRSAHGNDRGN